MDKIEVEIELSGIADLSQILEVIDQNTPIPPAGYNLVKAECGTVRYGGRGAGYSTLATYVFGYIS